MQMYYLQLINGFGGTMCAVPMVNGCAKIPAGYHVEQGPVGMLYVVRGWARRMRMRRWHGK
jgi:hypothetical protein